MMKAPSITEWVGITRGNDRDQLFGFHAWVSTQRRWLCVTVPKVACSRIKLTLHLLDGGADLGHLGNVHDQGVRLGAFPTDTITEILTSPDWFRFCFVRNPYGRLLSAYRTQVGNTWNRQYRWLKDDIKRALGYPPDQMVPERLVPFRDFVHYLSDAPEGVRRDGHFNLQTRILSPDVIAYDFTGRFESFQRDFEKVLNRLEAPPEIVATAGEVKNATSKVQPALAFDQELADAIFELYCPDFDAFGYDRDSWMYEQIW